MISREAALIWYRTRKYSYGYDYERDTKTADEYGTDTWFPFFAFMLQENVRKPCNVTPDTSPPEVTSGTGPDFCFRFRGF